MLSITVLCPPQRRGSGRGIVEKSVDGSFRHAQRLTPFPLTMLQQFIKMYTEKQLFPYVIEGGIYFFPLLPSGNSENALFHFPPSIKHCIIPCDNRCRHMCVRVCVCVSARTNLMGRRKFGLRHNQPFAI